MRLEQTANSLLSFSLLPLQSQDESRQQLREYEETKKQIEEDADREILDIKNKYERRLREEKEANLRLKGETGIMRKKVGLVEHEQYLKQPIPCKTQLFVCVCVCEIVIVIIVITIITSSSSSSSSLSSSLLTIGIFECETAEVIFFPRCWHIMIYASFFTMLKVKVLKQVVVPSVGTGAQIRYNEAIKSPGEL